MYDQIICSGINKSYGNKQVLKDVNLTLEKGKIYGLIGRNGAGKTTLLSIMSAQNPATSGEVRLDQEKVWENQKALDHICFSRELSATTFGNSTSKVKIKEYLRTASIYYPNWDEEMAQRLLKKFDLNIKQKLGQLSKGMLSMVTIIVALASKEEYTFLDEPVAGLDVVMREYFYKILLQEFMDTGRTFVISTHILEEASDIFEEVIIIRDGGILLKENTQELLERSYRVSGKAEDVDRVCSGLEVCHTEASGRAKNVTVMLEENQNIPESTDVTVQQLSLQNLFVALCGMED